MQLVLNVRAPALPGLASGLSAECRARKQAAWWRRLGCLCRRQAVARRLADNMEHMAR
jgi:hypothetical protein